MDVDMFQTVRKQRGLVTILRNISDAIDHNFPPETIRSTDVLGGWVKTVSHLAQSDQSNHRLTDPPKDRGQKRNADIIRVQSPQRTRFLERRQFATKEGIVNTVSKRKIMPSVKRRLLQPYPTRRVVTKKSYAASETDIHRQGKSSVESRMLALSSVSQDETRPRILKPLAGKPNLSSADFIDIRSVMQSSSIPQGDAKRQLLQALIRHNRPDESESSPCLIRGTELKSLSSKVPVKGLTESSSDSGKQRTFTKTATLFTRKRNVAKLSYRTLNCVKCDSETRSAKLVLLPAIEKTKKRTRSGVVEWASIKQEKTPVQLPVVSTPLAGERERSDAESPSSFGSQHRFWKSSNYDWKFSPVMPFILHRDERTQYRINAFDTRSHKKPCSEVSAITQSNVKVGIKHSSINKLVREHVQRDLDLPYVAGSKLNAAVLCNQLDALPTNFST